jgi:hypothetical protein
MKKADKAPKKTPSIRRQYSKPKVLSAEQLEAAAATCDPPVGGFGKLGPPACGTPGS